MAMQDELARPGTDAPTIDSTESTEWWHSRSPGELQAIVQRGVHGGEVFFAAAAEMERRSREAEAARDAEEVQEVQTSRRISWEVVTLLALLLVAAVILLLRLI